MLWRVDMRVLAHSSKKEIRCAGTAIRGQWNQFECTSFLQGDSRTKVGLHMKLTNGKME